MNPPDTPATAALLCAGRALPPPLAGLPVLPVGGPDDRAGVDAAIGKFARLVVVGDDAELALVLSRLLRAERLDVEVGYVARRRTPATGVYRLPTGRRAARRARYGTALPMPLIRDDTGTALVGVAHWLPAGDTRLLHGEGIVDDHALFDGDVAGVRIEPTPGVPGLRTAVRPGRGRMRRWVRGRAAQLGTTGARVVRDGVSGARTVKRSTFYRHVEGWLLVR